MLGKTLYLLVDYDDETKRYKRVKPDFVTEEYTENGVEMLSFDWTWHDQPKSEIGKTIFYTKEEAEIALQNTFELEEPKE